MSTISENAKPTLNENKMPKCSDILGSTSEKSGDNRQPSLCDNMKSMNKYRKIWKNGCVDYDMMSKLITDDIVMNEPSGGEIKGKKDFIEHFKEYNQSFHPLYVKIRHSTLEKDGSVLCLWSYWGKFTKEYMGVKPNNQFLHMEGCSRYCFNNNGHLFRVQSFHDGTSFEETIKKSISSRERLCSDYFKFLNGEITSTVMRNNYDKCATFSDAKKKNCDIDKMIPLMERFGVFAPNTTYDFECAPSCDDFDLWIGCYTLKTKIEHENQMGLSIGKCFEIPGMVTFRFNQNDQIIQQNDTFNINDFYKK